MAKEKKSLTLKIPAPAYALIERAAELSGLKTEDFALSVVISESVNISQALDADLPQDPQALGGMMADELLNLVEALDTFVREYKSNETEPGINAVMDVLPTPTPKKRATKKTTSKKGSAKTSEPQSTDGAETTTVQAEDVKTVALEAIKDAMEKPAIKKAPTKKASPKATTKATTKKSTSAKKTKAEKAS